MSLIYGSGLRNSFPRRSCIIIKSKGVTTKIQQKHIFCDRKKFNLMPIKFKKYQMKIWIVK